MVKLFLPPHVVAEKMAKNRERLEKEIMEMARASNDPSYKEEMERKLRSTKPMMIMDRSVDGRPVIVVGGGKMFREDMRDLAKRTLEKPDPKKDPAMQRNLKEDVLAAVDIRFRDGRGMKTFHIKNNPIHKEETNG